MNTNNNTELGSLFVCDCEGNNAEPLNAADKPYSREDALTAELDEPGVTLREATAADGLNHRVDYVAESEDGEIVGYYQWRAADTAMNNNPRTCREIIAKIGEREFVADAGDEQTLTAYCWTDDPEVLEWQASFGVTTSWGEGVIGRYDNAHGELDGAINNLIKQIKESVGGEWIYNPANQTIDQL